ncbi:50S ribosomal protein L23 [Candidatus Bathyarchaeota archaeon]|nr:50S ribosomal protein L23 [Candidatus Bathyarchaeota archaeon]MBS7613011.1 50S ribosomal protein L23 [Candidatus Bathyarchaeota archaeon]MBS7617576.1 50S ribosomal protein L23 [Candidatus Bathyarchaeota archaeon]
MENVWLSNILLYPLMTEKAINLIESQNKLTFIVNIKASKNDVKRAFEKFFNVKVSKVGTATMPDGRKKAYITLSPEYNASDIAVRLGIL